MKYKITHTTSYNYMYPTTMSYNEAWVSPRSLGYQQVINSKLTLSPQPSTFHSRRDFFGNQVSFFIVQEPHHDFVIKAESEIIREVPSNSKMQEFSKLSWEIVRDNLASFSPDLVEVQGFSLPSPLIPLSKALSDYAKPSFLPGRPLFEATADFSNRIFKEFEYDPGYTTVTTPVQKALTARKGVCQDFAQIAIGCLRSLGLAARYVSGYIETLPPEGSTQLIGSAASHAWFSVYIPELGWVDFDPTNDQLAGEQHITVAWGRDYSDVPPLKGIIFNGNDHELEVTVDVIRIS